VMALDRGRVREEGTPASLVVAGGIYASLVAAWEGRS
jgi:ABC-type multidrug transport system fused ATPase/permease subunit